MEIEKVLKTDLPEILALQHLAYQSEANLFSSRDIPPLRQTIEELTAEYQKTAVQFWKVSVQGKIVGSVRTEKQKETVLIGKLMVLPAYQKQGIGSQMMKMVEQMHQGYRLELFTSTRSLANIRLYEKLGYLKFRDQKINDELTLVFMEKNAI
ncbi:MAG: GNAT family N-acetyltransferase [Oxalobacter sp.]